MTCDINKEQLLDFVYNEMDVSGHRQMENHIRACEVCQSEIRELNQLRDTLGGWKEKEVPFRLTFVQPSREASWIEKIKQFFSNKKVAWFVPAVVVSVFALLSVFNTRIVYDRGRTAIYFGDHKSESQHAQWISLDQVQSMQYETLQLVQQMIRASESQQAQQTAGQLTRLAQMLETQRQRDLMMFSQGLEGLHLNTLSHYQQTNALLVDLIQNNYPDSLQ